MTRDASKRITAMSAVLAALLLCIVGRLVQIQLIGHAGYVAAAAASQSRKFSIPAQRGELYAYDGDEITPLVLNQTLQTVYADPTLITNKSAVSSQLAAVLGGSAGDYEKKLATKGNYVVLAEKVSETVASALAKKDLLGIGMVPQTYRTYPEGDLASQLLGFVNADGVGQYGVEGYLNKKLAGTPGLRKLKTDTRGNPIAIAGSVDQPAVDGASYVLTIDRNIQAQAEKYLKDGVERVGAKSGSVVIVDPHTGAVKAMANYPTYDPAQYQKVANYNVFSNTVVADQFEPGSGFKVITMAAGLDSGKVKPTTTYNDTGEVKLDGYTINNSLKKSYGVQAMGDVIEKSLNTGVVFVLRMLGGNPDDITLAGKKLLHRYISDFGFGKPTGVEQTGEASGAVNQPSTKSGNNINYANMTFGQGISVTMLQMTMAVAAIANGGKLYEPHVVAGVKNGETVTPIPPKVVNPQVISSQAARDLTTMMERVVQGKYGSGYKARMAGYTVAGKTGTAQIPKPDGTGYLEDKNIGSFVGFAPSRDPQFVMMVRVNEPKIDGFAESTTVPIFADIAGWMIRYMQIAPSS